MSNSNSNSKSNDGNKEKKVRKDKIELNDKQKMFIENYLFNGNNGAKAYSVAYDNPNMAACAVRASNLMKLKKISNEIATRQAEIKEHHLTHIATGEEVLQFYTQVMINPENKLDHRMKAGEYIGKSMGLFIERHKVNNTTDFQINLGFSENDMKMKIIEQQPVENIFRHLLEGLSMVMGGGGMKDIK